MLRLFSRRRSTNSDVEPCVQSLDLPSLRLALGIEAVGEEGPDLRDEVGCVAFLLGAGRAEIDEPILEDRPRGRFQRLVHPPIQFDLIIERAEDSGDCSLFWWVRKCRRNRMNKIPIK